MRFSFKTSVVICLALALFCAGMAIGKQDAMRPKSVIHVVTLDWADGISDEAKQAALDGVAQMGTDYDGITRVWLKSIKSQTKQAAFAMEFKDEQALKDYSGSDAQKKWYEVYLPARGGSVTSDITN